MRRLPIIDTPIIHGVIEAKLAYTVVALLLLFAQTCAQGLVVIAIWVMGSESAQGITVTVIQVIESEYLTVLKKADFDVVETKIKRCP